MSRLAAPSAVVRTSDWERALSGTTLNWENSDSLEGATMCALNHRHVAATLMAAAALALIVGGSGCGTKGGTTAVPSGPAPTTAIAETSTDADDNADAASLIPPGREIAEGGGGPTQYTFREQWRHALSTAGTWRPGAYLIGATGDMINDEGVPSSWRLLFIDKPQPDALLMVDIDPWGKVTEQRELTGDKMRSFVNESTRPIPFDVIDSDEAVTAGKKALEARYDLDKTKNPRVGLNFSVTDGSGPFWIYTLFYTPKAEYVTARMDALTGEVVPAE